MLMPTMSTFHGLVIRTMAQNGELVIGFMGACGLAIGRIDQLTNSCFALFCTSSVQGIVETRMYCMSTNASVRPQGEVSNLQVIDRHGPHDTVNRFFTGLLGRGALSH
jgi:hypothetical protein